MSDMGDLAKKAEQFGKDHPQDVDKGVEEAEKAANQRTGNKYDDQIKKAGDQAEQRLGGGQGQQQGQQPDQQQQDQQQGQ